MAGNGRAVLKVGASAALDQQGVAGKKPVSVHECEMPGRVPRRVTGLQADTAEGKGHAIFNADVGAGQAVESGSGNLAANLFFELQRGGDVVGVNMRV